jgi:hypothetical protein
MVLTSVVLSAIIRAETTTGAKAMASELNVILTVLVPERIAQALRLIAFNRSTADCRVTASDIMRKAFDLYLAHHASELTEQE